MKILHSRFGFSANSSSEYSLLVMPEPNHSKESLILKKNLIGASIARALLQQNVDDALAIAIGEAWSLGGSASVDYNKYPALPMASSVKVGINKQFLEELRDAIYADPYIVASEHSDTNLAPFVELYSGIVDSSCVARKDPKHGFWTLFNKYSGDKIRIDFNDSKRTVPITRASTPELLDIKVTNFCDRNCYYCYQDSTVEGRHADWETVEKIIFAAKQNDVFEIVIGGGEPTKWPYFVDLLQIVKEQGMAISFTTKDLSWMNDDKLLAQVKQHADRFAYSVDSADEMREFAAMTRFYGISGMSSVQIIPALIFASDLENIFKVSDYTRITLLDLVSVGRAANIKQKSPIYVETLAMAMLHNTRAIYYLGISANLARRWSAELAANNVADVLYDTTDGGYSMYFDAVERKFASDSFSQTKMSYMHPKEGFKWFSEQ